MSKISEILKQEREKQGLSLEEVSKKTRISITFLNLIESNEIEKLPSYAHAFGFIRSYASYLKLNEKEIEDIFKKEFSRDNFGKKNSDFGNTQKKKIKSRKPNFNKVLLITLGATVALSLIIFFTYTRDSVKETLTYSNETIKEKVQVDNTSQDNNGSNDTNSESNDNISSSVNNDNVSGNSKTNVVKFDPEMIAKEVFKSEKSKDKSRVVTLSFNDICWIHLKVDNETDYDFIAEKGLVKNIKFDNFFRLDIGNALAVMIQYKDQIISDLGGYRQPLKNLYFYINDNDSLVFEK